MGGLCKSVDEWMDGYSSSSSDYSDIHTRSRYGR